MGEDRLGRREDCRPVRVEAVESAGAREAFELAAVEQPRIDSRGEILEALERPAPLPLLDQRLHRLLADALQCAQGIADGPALDREICMTSVDVRRQAFDP